MPRVDVIGGSIGGLTAALVLRDAGCDVQVYERSDADLVGRGAGIVVHPMTIRYFAENNVLELDRISLPSRTLRYINSDGTIAHEEQVSYRLTAWNTLYRALRACLEPDRYHLGQTMGGFEQTKERVLVRFASGHEEECDLLVCADGVASSARGVLFPGVKPLYAGYLGWRGTVPESRLMPARVKELGASITYHLMPNSHILAYAIPAADGSVEAGHRLLNFVWYRNVPEGPEFDELMRDRIGVRHDISLPPGAVRERFVEELRQTARDLPESFKDVVSECAEPFVQAIVDLEVPWMVDTRVCLIGDAAFTARPHAAAGTAKVCADAWALADAVRAAEGDVVRALQAWEPGQLALGRQLIGRAREMGNRSQFNGTWRPEDRSLRFGLWEPGR